MQVKALRIGMSVVGLCLSLTATAAADAPRLCLLDDAGTDRTGCRGAPAEVLEPNRPITIRVDVPLAGAPRPLSVVRVSAAHAQGRPLAFEPVVRDSSIAERRFDKIPGRQSFRLASGDEAGNYRPKWHADGRYLVWHQIGDVARLWCLDVDAAEPAPRAVEFPDENADELFGETADGISHFEWVPGTTSVLVRLTRARELRRVDFENCKGEVTPAAELPEATDFALSPDGRWMVWRPAGAERLVVGPVGGEPVGELCGPNADPMLRTSVCRGVRWRPDGGAVAFWRAQSGRSGGQQVIWTPLDLRRKVIGRPRLVEVTGGAASARNAKKPAMAIAFSPSGEHLAFVSGGRINIVDTRAAGPKSVARPLSMSRGRYNSNKSDIVWLDTHHIAAVIDGTGGQHPIVVAHVDPARQPSMLSRAFPTHYDLAWASTTRRLAVSGFVSQQSIWIADVLTTRPDDSPPPEYFLAIREGESAPVNLTGSRPTHRYADGLELDARWEPVSGADAARLTLTFVLRKSP